MPVILDNSKEESGVNSQGNESDPTLAKRNASWMSCYFNMTNTICGAGVLGFPYAFANTGWVLGCILLVSSGIFSVLACHLMTLVMAKVGTPTSMYKVLAPVGKIATRGNDIFMIIYTFGAGCAYMVVIGDLMPDAAQQLGATGMLIQRRVWVILGFCFAAPPSIPHNIDFLKFTSGVCVVFLVFVGILVFLYALPSDATGLDPCDNQHLDDDSKPCVGDRVVAEDIHLIDVMRVVSIFVFAFGCQITCFPVANELIDVSQKRLDSVFAVSVATASVLYITVAVGGYITYADSVKSDLLINYPANPLLSCARIMISTVVAFSYPLQCNPSRRCFITLMEDIFNEGQRSDAMTNRFRYYGFTAAFLTLSLIVGLTVEDLGVVIGLIGATGGTLLMFILPGGLFLWHFPLIGDHYHDRLNSDDAEFETGSDVLISKFGHNTSAKTERLLGPEESHYLLSEDLDAHTDPSSMMRQEMPIPRPPLYIRYVAWTQLIMGIILMPVCLIVLFI
jgi:amino acid permease